MPLNIPQLGSTSTLHTHRHNHPTQDANTVKGSNSEVDLYDLIYNINDSGKSREEVTRQGFSIMGKTQREVEDELES